MLPSFLKRLTAKKFILSVIGYYSDRQKYIDMKRCRCWPSGRVARAVRATEHPNVC